MIGETDMTWTAILEKDGETSTLCFSSTHDPKEAFMSIRQVIQCDGFKVTGLLKGDHTQNFYGIDVRVNELLTGD
jgi:hypothetical protein